MIVRVVSNNDQETVMAGPIAVSQVTSLGERIDGRIRLEGIDYALDPVVIYANYGQTIQIYH